jgi:hypothetical protein
MPRRQNPGEGLESPPFIELQCETGVGQPEGIGPSSGPHSNSPVRDDMASPVPDDTNIRADTISAQGNCPEKGSMEPYKSSMCRRAGPSKGKSKQPLETCKQWPQEHSGSCALLYSRGETTALTWVTAVAEWLSDLQAELLCQDEKFDTLVKAMSVRIPPASPLSPMSPLPPASPTSPMSLVSSPILLSHNPYLSAHHDSSLIYIHVLSLLVMSHDHSVEWLCMYINGSYMLNKP